MTGLGCTRQSVACLFVILASAQLVGAVQVDPSSYTDLRHHIDHKWWEIALPSWPGITELIEFSWLWRIGLGPISQPPSWTKTPPARTNGSVPHALDTLDIPLIESDPKIPDIHAIDLAFQRGVLMTFGTALLVFFGAPVLSVILTYCLPPLTSKNSSVIRRNYGYIFCAHLNPIFGANLEISVRATVGILCLTLPFLLPSLKEVVEGDYYTILAIIIYFLTLGKTVGGSLQVSYGVCFGVFLAVLNVYVMNGINPGGVQKGSGDTVFWVGVADYCLFTLVLLATGFGYQVKIPGMIFHGVFMMDFLNPNSTNKYSKAWQINMEGVAVGGIVQCMIGAGLGVLTCIVPYPLFALNQARDISLNLVEEMAEAWQAGIKCFCSASDDESAEATLRHDIDKLSSDVASLGGLEDASWWECLGLPGKPERVRVMLFTLSGTIQESYKRLINVHHLCRVTAKTPEHVELMEHMKPHLENLTKQSSDLLLAFVEAAIDGSVDEAEEAHTKELQNNVEQALTTVSNEFHKKHDKMKVQLFDAASFCFSYSLRAQRVLDFEEQGKQSMKQSSTTLLGNLGDWVKSAQTTIFHDAMAFNCWLRSIISIFLVFVVGINGYSTILPSYSAVGLETVCLLLSPGSTMQAKSNLDRFLSVVVGSVFGQLAYSFLGGCSVWSKTGIVLFIISWSFMMLFMVNHYGQGLLCGFMLVYTLIGVLIPCSDKRFEAGGSYGTIISTTVAITIKVLVDIFLARARASEMASTTLVSAWDQLEKALVNLFDPAVKEVTFTSSAIADTFNTAKNFSEDAYKEPRYWWCDWKHNLFVQTCDAGVKLSQMLSSLEATFCDGHDGGVKSPRGNALVVFQKLESSTQVNKDLILRIKCLRNLCSLAFSYTKTDFFAAHYQKPKDLDDYSTVRNRVYEVASRAAKEPDGMGKKNLTNDLVCKMGKLINSVQGMHEVMKEIETNILSA